MSCSVEVCAALFFSQGDRHAHVVSSLDSSTLTYVRISTPRYLDSVQRQEEDILQNSLTHGRAMAALEGRDSLSGCSPGRASLGRGRGSRALNVGDAALWSISPSPNTSRGVSGAWGAGTDSRAENRQLSRSLPTGRNGGRSEDRAGMSPMVAAATPTVTGSMGGGETQPVTMKYLHALEKTLGLDEAKVRTTENYFCCVGSASCSDTGVGRLYCCPCREGNVRHWHIAELLGAADHTRCSGPCLLIVLRGSQSSSRLGTYCWQSIYETYSTLAAML